MIAIRYGVLPATVALGIIVLSIQSIIRGFGLLQLALGVPTIAVAGWSLSVLKIIFVDNAWPTLLPHFTIAVCIPLAIIQWYAARRSPIQRSRGRARALVIGGAALLIVSAPPLVIMGREIAMSSAAAARYSVEHLMSREPGMAGGALQAAVGGHTVALEDDEPFKADGDTRVEGVVRILVDGRDYSTNSLVDIRLNSQDANRYWGYVHLTKLLDHEIDAEYLVVAQNLDRGRFRTLMMGADGVVAEDEFDYAARCDPPLRAILISYVVPSPIGRCFGSRRELSSAVYPVVYPWVSGALGMTWLINGILMGSRR